MVFAGGGLVGPPPPREVQNKVLGGRFRKKNNVCALGSRSTIIVV